MDRQSPQELIGRRMQRSGRSCAIRGCDWYGCVAEGLYRAPRSRTRLRDYWWFCLDHIRLYNAAWDYYTGMSEAEIEADRRSDTVWQRPSWPLGSAPHRAQFRWFDDGLGPAPEREPAARPVTAVDHAILVLELRPPVTVKGVKARYKELVKRYHPDANDGDKAAEEQFKVISEAYRTLISSLNS